MKNKLNLAIVADWITNNGGAEQVIGSWHETYPNAPIYTTIYNREKMPQFEGAEMHVSSIQKMPMAKNKFQYYLGQMPSAFESFNLNNYDIVLSSSHACAKGVITKPETMHVCYCHTPPRYIWEPEADDRLANVWFPASIYAKHLMTRLRIWDRLAADRVDHFVANSAYIAKRIEKFYHRDATVIYPPVDVDKFHVAEKPKNYFFAIGRLIKYKRFDLTVQACTALGVPLKIAGSGPELENLKKMAGPTVEFLGRVPDEDIPDLYANAQATIFPQLEDFGITAVESQAAGRPVIAYRAGGALETVVDGVTGAFFDEQTVDSLARAIRNFDTFKVRSQDIRTHAMKFSRENHLNQLDKFLRTKYAEYQMGKYDQSLGNL